MLSSTSADEMLDRVGTLRHDRRPQQRACSAPPQDATEQADAARRPPPRRPPPTRSAGRPGRRAAGRPQRPGRRVQGRIRPALRGGEGAGPRPRRRRGAGRRRRRRGAGRPGRSRAERPQPSTAGARRAPAARRAAGSRTGRSGPGRAAAVAAGGGAAAQRRSAPRWPSWASPTSGRPPGPSSFDCSGLIQYAYAAAGISLPHSSGEQASMGTPCPGPSCSPATSSLLQPGQPRRHVHRQRADGARADVR